MGMEGTAGTTEATFLFADLAGFTALTEAHGDQDAANCAARFYQLARAALVADERIGDYFGATVNLAARVTAHARSGQVLCAQPVAEAIRDLPAIRLQPIGLA